MKKKYIYKAVMLLYILQKTETALVFCWAPIHNKVKDINHTHSKKKVNSLGGPGVVESGVLLRHWQKRRLVCNESLIESCPICGPLSDLSGFFCCARTWWNWRKFYPMLCCWWTMQTVSHSEIPKHLLATVVLMNVPNNRLNSAKKDTRFD